MRWWSWWKEFFDPLTTPPLAALIVENVKCVVGFAILLFQRHAQRPREKNQDGILDSFSSIDGVL